MNKKEIKELIEILEESGLRKLVLKEKDFEIHLEKDGYGSSSHHVHERAPEPHLQAQHASPKPSPSDSQPGHFVTSPMVGTFYSTPAPDQPDFVKVGDRVEEGTTVCIIEAMKVMNEVKAGKAGKIAEVLLGTSDPVEFGTKLFRIV